MSTDIFEQILQDHKELSSLPQTLAEVLRVVRDEEASVSGLAEVLLRDPAMTTKILRVVNSPFYGAGREISNMNQAIMTLGMRAVSALALSTSVYDMTGKWQGSVDRVRFWRHSLEVALASRLIAEALGTRYPDEAFVCGLLHDIGILVLEKSFPEKYERIWKQAHAGEKLSDLEDSFWGTDHARIGQFLLEQWQLPRVICEAVGQHHGELNVPADDEHYRVAQIVALANSCSKFTIVSGRPDLTIDMDRKNSLCEVLAMDPEVLKDIEQTMMSRMLGEAEFLEMDIGSTDEVLIEANRMIYQHYLAVENLLRENRRMHREVARAQMEKAALDVLKTITATFHHYINNAAATILGRAQLIEIKAQQGGFAGEGEDAASAMQIIISGVNTICSVMDELKDLTQFKTTVYHDDTYIIDIEARVRKRVEALSHMVPAP